MQCNKNYLFNQLSSIYERNLQRTLSARKSGFKIKIAKTMLSKTSPSPNGLSIRDLCIIIAVYTISFLVVSGFPHSLTGFPLDDSWIHQVVARNLAHNGKLGFVPNTESSGSSSLLWSFVLAANLKFLPAVGPVLYSAILNICFLIAIGCGLLGMARKDGLSPTACWLWALTPALDGNFIWLGVIGMEHLLFVTFSVLGIYLWFQTGQRSAICSSLCLGALCLTRPEGLALAGLILLLSPWMQRTRKEIATFASIVAISILITLTANRITSHAWLPTTYEGRKWLYFGSNHVPLLARISFPYVLLRNLLQPWAIVQTHPLYIFNALITILMATGIWNLVSERRIRTSFLVFWNIALVLIYSLMLPTRSHGGRYQPLFLALSFPLMFLGIQFLLSRAAQIQKARRSRSTVQTAIILVTCIICGIFSLKGWRRITNSGIELINNTHGKMGDFLVKTLPPQSRVASFDIGRIGYIYGGNLVDLGGLTDSSFLPYMREHRVFSYLKDRNIDYLVLPTPPSGEFSVRQIFIITPEQSRDMTRVAQFCVPYKLWLSSFAFTSDAAQCQTLYRLHFSDTTQAAAKDESTGKG